MTAAESPKTDDLEFEDADWYAYGYRIDAVKYVHTDPLMDAIVYFLQ